LSEAMELALKERDP